MRDRIERFAFPFSVGCVSHSSVDVIVESQPKKSPRSDRSNAIPTISELVLQSNEKTRTSFLMIKPNISAGIHKVVKGFKNLSYMFQFYKYEEEEEEEEEGRRDMVIGFPTDVQHVTHIGWDGFNSTGSMKRQFELSMGSPAD